MALCPMGILAQNEVEDPESLQAEIMRMDSLLFEVGFNECNYEVWNKILAQDFEFYDDRMGLNTDREREVAAYYDRCGKAQKVTRRLVSCGVYPLKGYGAFQEGVHDFYVADQRVEQAKFAMIWRKNEAGWQVVRVVSYDHQQVE